MAFDGITTYAIVSELKSTIINGRIDKISEPNKNEIILKIYSEGKNYALNACIDASNCRLCLTKNTKENPLSALNFCMVLRKHILGFRISSISTHGLDRIVKITLDGYEENVPVQKYLFIELMGKHGNIILVDSNNLIIDSLRHFSINSGSNREILPNRNYTFLPNDKYDFLQLEDAIEFYKIITDNYSQSLSKTISNQFIGFSNTFINYMITSLDITKLDETSAKELFTAIKDIINNIANTSCISTINEKNKSDFVIYNKQKQNPLEINFFIDDFYYNKETRETFINEKSALERIVLDAQKKYKTRLNNINEKLAECDRKDLYRLYGELITNNLYRIKNTNCNEISLENYYDNNNLLTIPLDISISVSANAKKYFKKYNKLKTAFEIASTQRLETETELNYIDTIIYELENATSINDLKEIRNEISENIIFKQKNTKSQKKKKENTTSSPDTYLIDGFKVFVGKNNKQNDYLTTKFANPFDTWFHTKDIHGSHVILRANCNEVPSSVLEKCAQLAAFNSKGRLSSNVAVDYCLVKHVKKPNGSKPGMVIYSNNKTLFVNPDELNKFLIK